MPSFDEVLKQAGDFGKFQKKAFFLLCQTGITFSFLFVGIVFLGRDPEQYWCRIPCVSELKKQCEWTLEEEYNITIQASSLVNFSQCQRHDIKCNNTRHNCTYPLAHLTNNNFAGKSFTTCQDGWLFKKPHSTIASEYELVCDKKWIIDITQSILNMGFLVGGFVLGYAADRLVPESPRWLITRKKANKALQIMQSVAKENGQSLPVHFSEITVSDEEVSNPSLFDLVRTPQMRKFTLILMYAWFTSAVVYQGLVLRLGLIEGNLYLEFFISAVIELPSAFLILATIDRLGRRPLFASGTLVAGVACLITAFLPKDIPQLSTAVAILARLGITITFELVYLVNSELYPTVFRNFGVSLCSGMCDIGGTVAPFLLYRLAAIWSELPLIVYCILSLLCGILVLLLPETKGQPLPETVEDVEKM
ncbi:Solute carrier family 22 member 3, partial [Ophiophagus hannah]